MNNKKHIKQLIAIGLCATFGLTGVLFADSNHHQAYANPSAQITSSSKADQIIKSGSRFMGVPYTFGARSGDTNTFDCSSFTQYLFKQIGIDLPRSSIEQSHVGQKVSKSDLQVGDLVFFSTTDRNGHGNVNHVAIYAGNGRILHTYGSPGVTFSDLDAPTWKDGYVGARRVL
ncbi:hydrolase [Paenibacillus selenitireducens]|uniref:Hydrolase n=1 Tax=Paenibacillus selenitireducens TaxID=1324314 RepID=A0A1T2X4N4_9BACL|nr:C40 family peptidase [Paenibacillus selenitireducens]OPA74646.1 hydrolase [Paenibacillus selenitireducens]